MKRVFEESVIGGLQHRKKIDGVLSVLLALVKRSRRANRLSHSYTSFG